MGEGVRDRGSSRGRGEGGAAILGYSVFNSTRFLQNEFLLKMFHLLEGGNVG